MTAPALAQIAQEVLLRLGLAGARFAGDNDRLTLTTEALHIAVGFVGYNRRSASCSLVAFYQSRKDVVPIRQCFFLGSFE